jgi:anti-sigma factor RsiW
MTGCSHIQRLISTSRDRTLDPADADALERHLATCEDCRAFADELTMLGHAMAGWTTPEPRVGFARRTMHRLPPQHVTLAARLRTLLDLHVLTPAAATVTSLALGVLLSLNMTAATTAQEEDAITLVYAEYLDVTPYDSLGEGFIQMVSDTE